MLRELTKEIIELLNESEAKDIRITELESENVKLKEANATLNAQILELQAKLEVANKEITSLNGVVEEKEVIVVRYEDRIKVLEEEVTQLTTSVSELQAQADLKLEEVKAIVKELKELVVNA